MVTKKQKMAVMLSVGMLASLVGMPKVYADLVLDSPELQNTVRVDERENSRNVVQSARRAEISSGREAAAVQAPVTSAPIQVQQAPVIQYQTVPAVVAQPMVSAPVNDSGAVEVQHLSKSELLRRKRVRDELRNEDVLLERLEELRLRDEQKRSDQLMGGPNAGLAMTETAPGFAAVPAQPQTTVISGAAPVAVMPVAPVAAPSDKIVSTQASTMSSTEALEKPTTFSLSPRAGMSNMNGVQTFDITPRFAAGLGLGLNASDNVSIELGWLYSEYGIKTNSSNPYVQNYQYSYAANGASNNPNFEALSLKQNVFELGMKLALLGPDSKIRPFIGFGGAYSKSFINYDRQVIDYLNQTGAGALANDYELNQYLGYLSTGLDVKISRNLSIGITGRYYSVLSARENTQINNAAVNYGYGYNNNVGYTQYGYAPSDQDKRTVSGSLAKQSFYSLLAGVTFSF